MPQVLTDLTNEAAVLDAIDGNVAERVALYERFAGDPEVYRREDCLQVVSKLAHPIANQVHLTRFDDEQAESRIDETLTPYVERGLPCHWWVGCTSRPADLPARLEKRGFHETEEETGMAATLDEMDLEPPIPAGVAIQKVRDEASLDVFFQAFNHNGLPSPLSRQIHELYRKLGFGEERPMHQYVAVLDGEPVATSAALYAEGVVGLYNVGTFPAARGRGIGTAISAAAFREAADRGYQVAIVVSTPMGRNVYKRLGFKEVCKLSIYEWRPSDLA